METNARRGTGAAALAGMFFLSSLLGMASCHRTGVEYRPGRAVGKLPAASVVASSDAAYRLIISPNLRDQPSRLWVVHARIATFDNVPLRIGTDGAQLVLPDGTRVQPFDQARVVALLERSEIGKGDLEYTHETARPPTGGLPYQEKERIRGAILASPFVARELTRSQPIEGYMVVDTKRELASLEGVALEVFATRTNDGAFVRRVYRFSAPGEKAHAQTATSSLQP